MLTHQPISLMLVLALFSLIPIIFILTTSFIKIAMVCILARESLGVQQVPPNIVIYGLSLILAFYIMGPVYKTTFNSLTQNIIDNKELTGQELIMQFQSSTINLKAFLAKHSNQPEREFFYLSLKKYWTPEMTTDIKKDDLLILIPSFVISEITQAFKIGFLIYLPSVIIDIIISNILMAMGMMMMSPVTISLPLKLLLFVSIDGWRRLIEVLMGTY